MKVKKHILKTVSGLIALAMVISGALSVPVPVYATSNSAVVNTQKQLNAALSDKKVNKITIKNTNGERLTVKNGKYTGKTLVVNDMAANIINNGRFKSISIKDAGLFTENASNNSYKVIDGNGIKFNISKGSKGAKINSKSGYMYIVADGDIASLKIAYKEYTYGHWFYATYRIEGSTQSMVNISASGKQVNLTTNVPVMYKSNCTSYVHIGAGAEGSLIKSINNASVSVDNYSDSVVYYVDNSGKKKEIQPAERANETDAGKTAEDKSDEDEVISDSEDEMTDTGLYVFSGKNGKKASIIVDVPYYDTYVTTTSNIETPDVTYTFYYAETNDITDVSKLKIIETVDDINKPHDFYWFADPIIGKYIYVVASKAGYEDLIAVSNITLSITLG